MIKKTCILILNWNGWKDTIECIESTFLLKTKNYQLVIIDNDSSDNSVEEIIKYIELKHHKIKYIMYNEEALEKDTLNGQEYDIVIIKNSDNYGFGKGNNTGLKYALKNNFFEYIWLLNSDAIVEEETLDALVKQIDGKIGYVGSVIRYYDFPKIIQCIGGGKFFPFLGLSKLQDKGLDISKLSFIDININLDYIMGASLLIKRKALLDVGLFDEQYFMYAEELDMLTRAKKKGWKMSVALDSYIYHKDSSSTKNTKGYFYYLLNRSNIIYMKKFYKFHLLSAVPFLIIYSLKLLTTKGVISSYLKGIIDGLRGAKL